MLGTPCDGSDRGTTGCGRIAEKDVPFAMKYLYNPHTRKTDCSRCGVMKDKFSCAIMPTRHEHQRVVDGIAHIGAFVQGREQKMRSAENYVVKFDFCMRVGLRISRL